MPTYNYECQKCGLTFEKFQNMTDANVKECPKCRSAVKKLISSGSGIILKGKGFYQTDYKSAPTCPASQGSGSSSSGSPCSGGSCPYKGK